MTHKKEKSLRENDRESEKEQKKELSYYLFILISITHKNQ